MVHKVLIVEDITEPGKKLLRDKGYEIRISTDTSIEALKRDIADCDAVLSKTVLLTREVLEAGKKLKVIGKHGAGVDNVVRVEDATELGIRVVYTPFANSVSVAEYTLGFIIALAKHLTRVNAAMEKADFSAGERWQSSELGGKTLGLVGLGKIGGLVARKAHLGLDMRVIAYDPYVAKKDLPEFIELVADIDTVFATSDFLSLHLPSTKESVGLVDYARLARMKRSAYFINCARGSIVREDDLVRALREGVIAGAAIDVYQPEPPQPENPLLAMDNVIHTAHSAALSKEALDRMSHGPRQWESTRCCRAANRPGRSISRQPASRQPTSRQSAAPENGGPIRRARAPLARSSRRSGSVDRALAPRAALQPRGDALVGCRVNAAGDEDDDADQRPVVGKITECDVADRHDPNQLRITEGRKA